MKKIIGLILFLVPLGLAFQANAGMVPGTISKGAYTDNVYCNSSNPSYSPTGGSDYCSTYNSCATSACGVQTYNTCADAACGSHYNTCAAPACGCASYNGSGACVAYNSCADSSCGSSYNSCATSACGVQTYNTCAASACGCAAYTSYPTGSYSLTDYTDNSKYPSFNSAGVSRKLTNDIGRTCSEFAYVTQNLVDPSWGTWYCPDANCSPSSISTRYGGSSAVCGSFTSTDNLVTTFDQLGNMTTSQPTDSNGTCTVEGRYATADDSGPSVSLNGVAGVFDGDTEKWCAMSKYRQGSYGTASNPELLGCTYYRNLNPYITGSDPKSTDLLKGLEITVSDPSGISSVQIEIGSCNATYTLTNSLSNILTGSSGGIKSAYTNITFKYDTVVNVDGFDQPSLLSKLGQTRLDGCLLEGKNYVKVTAQDSARSNADAVSFAPNTYVLDYSSQNKFIKVDNTTAKVKLTGDANKIYSSNVPANCFIGGATSDPHWKNYTISGGLQSGDPFGADGADCSPPVSLSGSALTCAGSANVAGVANLGGSNPQDPIYAAPGGINATTGTFTGYTIDGLGPNPNVSSCDWGCKSGYIKDPATKSCMASSNLFILFDSSSQEASGPFAAKLMNDASSHGALISETVAGCTVPNKASTSMKYKTYAYSAGAQYGPVSSLPASMNTLKFPIVVTGNTVCTPACWMNYYGSSDASGGSCTPYAQTAACALPANYANTVWNTKWSIVQAWNGSGPTSGAWAPTLPATTYDTMADDLKCNYKCASGYSWNGSACVQQVTNGACGTANGSTTSSTPTDNLCAAGTSTSVSGSGPWTWSCNGSNGGTNASCSANNTMSYCTSGGAVPCMVTATVDGMCGPASWKLASSAPSSDLCSFGTATAVSSDSSSWTWSCNGSNGGTNASCGAANCWYYGSYTCP